MKNILKELTKNKQEENFTTQPPPKEPIGPAPKQGRRDFFKKTALGGMSLAGMMSLSVEDSIAETTSKVQRSSNPSDLKITDMRYCVAVGRRPIIRIDTNQGIYGLGEVRDGADWRYALMLKSRLLGLNPTNVEMLFKLIKQFGGHARQGGGVSAVEMALWDLTGKAYNVPCWRLLGGKYREKIRMYAYVPRHDGRNMDVDKFKEEMKFRKEELGITWFKMYPSLSWIADIPGTTVNDRFWFTAEYRNSYAPVQTGDLRAKQPFTQTQITDKGLDELAKYVEMVRNVVGWDLPLGADGVGNYDVNTAIRVGKALDPYRLAFLEDFFPMDYIDQWKTVTDAIETPTLTGEDIYLKEKFIKLIDAHAVDIVQPDLATSGGLLETKIIGDYAESQGVPMILHFAGTPVSFMANIHCAAATNNVLSLEMPNNGSLDNPWWKDLVKTTDGNNIMEKGFALVPDSPGLGIELQEDVLKEHLDPRYDSFFKPTPEWSDISSSDYLWSGRTTGGTEIKQPEPYKK
ncbi:MAG: mandelate racemase/muconate lactonizing enzyme family protein [Bacteroidetes bacterium]|nr:mandelate racemase/muconate lactonizing enzyme family protein [Bacteroidota bacterium]MDA1119811.1 mandelate racemase/muconate lactonizing enzyme family protein [Bacteroidota bacterium]